jgi:hypothetical protein
MLNGMKQHTASTSHLLLMVRSWIRNQLLPGELEAIGNIDFGIGKAFCRRIGADQDRKFWSLNSLTKHPI